MPNRFLAAARQGKNGLGHYGLTLILCLVLTLGVMLAAMLPIIIAMAVMGIDSQAGLTALMSNPMGFSLFSAAISVLMVLGLWLAMGKIHRRPFMTLIRADQPIRWAQVAKAALVWFGLGLLNIGILALLSPGRYQVTFVLQDGLRLLMPVLIAIPAIALLQGLTYAYLLQGLGLLIRKPAYLTISIALLVGLLSLLGQPAEAPGTALITAFMAAFMVWIVLQNQGLEPLLGILAAMNAFQFWVLQLPDAPAPFPTVLQKANAGPDWLGTFGLLGMMVLFYATFFGLPWQRSRE